MSSYPQRLSRATAARGRLCVGIDPHPSLLTQWGLAPDVAGLEKCARGMVEALGERVAVFKPQSALFEAYGSAGVAVLERVLADCRQAGALSILDAKRGDFAPTMQAYARAYLVDDAPLGADALTVSPYLGVGSLQPAFEAAAEYGRGLYVLARTSNPEGGIVQLARTSEAVSVAQQVVDDVQVRNDVAGTPAFGLVVGATHDDLGCDLTGFTGSVLVPGLGAQGATVADIARRFAGAADLVLPTTSRQVMQAGPDPSAMGEVVAALLEQTAGLGAASTAG